MTIHRRALLVLALSFVDVGDRVGRRPHHQRRQEDHRQARRRGRAGRDVRRRRGQVRIPGKDIVVIDFGNKVCSGSQGQGNGQGPRITEIELTDGSTFRVREVRSQGQEGRDGTVSGPRRALRRRTSSSPWRRCSRSMQEGRATPRIARPGRRCWRPGQARPVRHPRARRP